MEGIFIVYVVVHFADRYLLVWVWFYFGWWFVGFPSWFGCRFDEGLVLRGFSGHLIPSGGGRSVRYIVYIWNIFSLCHSNASNDGYNFRILGSKTVSPLKSVKNSESSVKGDISIL